MNENQRELSIKLKNKGKYSMKKRSILILLLIILGFISTKQSKYIHALETPINSFSSEFRSVDDNPVTKSSAEITVLVPDDARVKLTIEGKETTQRGSKRVFMTPPLDPKKNYIYKVEALIEPNNYTKITRTREVKFKAGDKIEVDLRKEDKKNDKIVVRWVPTPEDIVDEMSRMAKISEKDVIYDPACGDAVMLIRPILKFKAKKGIGVDIDKKMVIKAKAAVKEAEIENKVIIREGDILNEKDMKDLSEATVVMLYIGDDLGARIEPLLRKLLKPGARIVSHRFLLGDWKPEKTVTVKGADGDNYTLHLWTVK